MSDWTLSVWNVWLLIGFAVGTGAFGVYGTARMFNTDTPKLLAAGTGYTLGALSGSLLAEDPVRRAPRVACEYCRTPIAAGAVRCQSCGAPAPLEAGT